MTKQPPSAPYDAPIAPVPTDPDAPDAIEELEDWQDHQYVPGYYTGSNLHPVLRHPGKPVWLGVVLLLLGSGSLGSIVLFAVQADRQVLTAFDLVVQNLLPLVLGVVMIAAGVTMVRRGAGRHRGPGGGSPR
jgi:hypothetical protein